MVRLIRLSKATQYAVQGLIHLACAKPGDFSLAEDSAMARKLPKSFLAKLFQRLARRGLLESRRGMSGGYSISRAPEAITLAEIVDAIEEPAQGRQRCLLGLRLCGTDRPCAVHGGVSRAENILLDRLKRVTLADLVKDDGVPRTSAGRRRKA